EAQLTTTFLDVVIGRKTFYRAEGGLLVWVLPHFDPAYRQLTVDDLLFNNNADVLILDRESRSLGSGRAVDAALRVPAAGDGGGQPRIGVGERAGRSGRSHDRSGESAYIRLR
ncbi:MAG TPA: hypothetical protein PLH31_19515, partial [Caulobacter sp.]|nr:hypothetical protein [Caulobacter sp.]